MALKRVWRPSPSYSPGSVGSSPRLLVCHTTEGATTNDNIANFLCGHNGVSYHASVDNYMDNTAYEYVYETDGAWAQCGYNSQAVCCVFCTPSGASSNWSADYWRNEQGLMFRNMARWLAEEATQHNIPLVALNSSQAQGSGRGVCEHQHLGSSGCGHHDCGNLPLSELVALAKDYQQGGVSAPEPPKPKPQLMAEEEQIMQLQFDDDGFCALGIPKYAGHLRLCGSKGGEVRVEWVGSNVATRGYSLDDKARHDVPCGPGSNGTCRLFYDGTGIVSGTWIQTN